MWPIEFREKLPILMSFGSSGNEIFIKTQEGGRFIPPSPGKIKLDFALMGSRMNNNDNDNDNDNNRSIIIRMTLRLNPA